MNLIAEMLCCVKPAFGYCHVSDSHSALVCALFPYNWHFPTSRSEVSQMAFVLNCGPYILHFLICHKNSLLPLSSFSSADTRTITNVAQ
jgi:hypothetical protein